MKHSAQLKYIRNEKSRLVRALPIEATLSFGDHIEFESDALELRYTPMCRHVFAAVHTPDPGVVVFGS